MPRKSTITQLPPEIRERLDQMIREGRMTIDDMVAEVRSLGGTVKRTAVGDYKQKMEASLARMREAQEVAGVWVKQLGASPDSPMGQLLADLLKTIAFKTIADLGDGDDPAKPMDIMLIAKALNDVARAQTHDHEFRRKLRDEFMAEMKARATTAADAVTKEAKSKGLTDDAVATLRKHVLGVVG